MQAGILLHDLKGFYGLVGGGRDRYGSVVKQLPGHFRFRFTHNPCSCPVADLIWIVPKTDVNFEP